MSSVKRARTEKQVWNVVFNIKQHQYVSILKVEEVTSPMKFDILVWDFYQYWICKSKTTSGDQKKTNIDV